MSILVAVLSTGAVSALISTIASYFIRKSDRRFNVSDEYRKRKCEAMDSLIESLNKLRYSRPLEAENTIIPIPRFECPARKIHGSFLPQTVNYLQDKEKLVEHRNSINNVVSNYRFWFSAGMEQALHYYLSYLDNLLFMCESGQVMLNNLLSVLLVQDFYEMNNWIDKEIKRNYFNKYRIKFKNVYDDKRYRIKFNTLHQKSSLGNLMIKLSNEEKQQQYKNIKFEESRIIRRYNLCMSCSLSCPLAKQDFICASEKEEVSTSLRI